MKNLKTIYMVFNDKEKLSVSSSLYENLKYVFEDYIKVKTCFLDEIDRDDIADGDLFIVLYKDRVYSMKDYTSSLDKVIVLSRTIQKRYLDEISSIPEGANVLVVNDSPESTLQTANTLYELGFNHLNLVPFDETADAEAAYKDIRIAITPNEVLMVPAFIRNIINIDDRYIDMNTFVTIINKLGLNNEKVTRNLIKYTELIAGTSMGVSQKYVANHLKSEMLKKMIHHSQEAVLLSDQNHTLVYANDRAQTLFEIAAEEENSGLSLTGLFQRGGVDIRSEEDGSGRLVRIGGTNYIINKHAVKILDQTVGYSIVLSDEKDIKKIGSDLNKQLVKTGLVAKYTFGHILCESEVMKKCISLAKKAALTDYTVLLNGESGTGKELVAQSIHSYSNRKKNAFVAINCAALPESLLESELFGYEKGAFTGASGNGKLGLFEQADKGTIFLDEIGDMSLNLQARLLRVLQEKQIMRLGSDRVIDVDIRIIAATNKNLMEEVKNKTFREDLYYRLCNIPVTLPPLRQRREDIRYLFREFLGSDFQALGEEELRLLERYDWPGNVRELKNAADYYRTLGELPAVISSGSETRTAENEEEKARRLILEIIQEHTGESSGIGRTAILYELQKKGVSISDDKARKHLSRLEERGFITVGKGRTGCRISQRGRDALSGA